MADVRQQNFEFSEALINSVLSTHDPLLLLVFIGIGVVVIVYFVWAAILYTFTFFRGTSDNFRLPLINGKHLLVDIRSLMKKLSDTTLKIETSLETLHSRLDDHIIDTRRTKEHLEKLNKEQK